MFPSPHSVEWSARVVGPEDIHGNAAIAYADPVQVPVIGWGPAGADQQPADDTRQAVIRSLDLFADSFPGGPLDRVQVGPILYEQVGHPADWRHGPFGFSPGVVVHLRHVEEVR